jgi:hypothetical protein
MPATACIANRRDVVDIDAESLGGDFTQNHSRVLALPSNR